MAKKTMILDRDGVINDDSVHHIRTPEEWRPIPGSLEAIAKLNSANWQVLVATNQSGLARGLFDHETLNDIHGKMQDCLDDVDGHVDGIAFCPHGPNDHCQCRKPKPGLLLTLSELYDINPRHCVMVGDAWRDILAAQAFGATPILVKTGKGAMTLAQHQHELGNVAVYNDLAAVVEDLV